MEASLSLISLFDTFALPGCNTSTTNWRRASSRLVMNLRVLMVHARDSAMAAIQSTESQKENLAADLRCSNTGEWFQCAGATQN